MSLGVVFAGTSQFALPMLRALMESRHQVIAVYTQPDRPAGRGCKIKESPVKSLASSRGVIVCQPPSLRGEEQKIMTFKADIIVVVAYGLLLPTDVLVAHRLGGVNVHASLLPRWRGAAPIQHAILAGDRETGLTVMKMNSKLDTGDILTQRSCFIREEDTAGSLSERLSLLGADLLIETLDEIESGVIQARRQNPKWVTYAVKIHKKDAELNWNQTAICLERQVRAFNPTPVAFTYFRNRPIRIWKARVILGKTRLSPGVLIYFDKNGLDIATGEGILRICQLQLPGKRIQLAHDFINAYRKELIPGETVFGKS